MSELQTMSAAQPPTSRPPYRRGGTSAARLPASRRPLAVRARSRRHHSRRICFAAPLSRRACRCRARSRHRQLSAPYPGQARRLAAVCRRRLRHERDGESLFRAQDDRRFNAGRSHAPRPRGDPRPRRRRARQCVHALPAGALRHRAVARGAGDAGRDHAAAEMVSVPSRQDLVLEPHRDRAASGADGEEAARAQSEGRARSTNCFSNRRSCSGRRRRRRSRRRRGSGSSAPSTMCCARRSRSFPKARGSARSIRPWPGSASGSTARTASARFSRPWPTA